MRVAVVLVAAGILLMLWIKHSPRTADYPHDGVHAPVDRTINQNRSKR